MASSNSLSVCNIQTVHYSAQQSRAESEMGAAENQDAAPLPWTREHGRLRALVPSVCHLGEARLAHTGTLCLYKEFHEAELMRRRTLVLAVPTQPSVAVRGAGDADAPASSGPLFSRLQWEAKGFTGGRKEKEKGVRPGALTSKAFLL